MGTTVFDGNLRVTGNLQVDGKRNPSTDRDEFTQENLVPYPISLVTCFVDTTGQPLPSAATGTILTLAPGTYGTGAPALSAGDLKAAGATTRRARCVMPLPAEYVAGQTVQIRASAGMLTTVADTTCTLAIEAYKVARDSTVGGSSNLVTTSAQTINSLTFADKVYAVTPAGLSPGDQLDIRVSIACNDAATATAVKATIGSIEMLLDIQG